MDQASRLVLVNEVRAYAEAHYEEGWDVIVECYDDDELAEEIGNARTLNGAIRKLAKGLDLRASVRHDVRASSGEYDDVPPPAPVAQPKRKTIDHGHCGHPRTAKARAECRKGLAEFGTLEA